MTVVLSREISSGLSPMSCVQTLQTCLAVTCLLVWSHESGQDLTSRVRELVALLYFFSDRQLNLEGGNYLDEEENMKNFLKHEDENTFYTYLDTVSPVMLAGEGQYNLNVLKQIEVTESFLGLDESDRGCQNQEPYDNCTTRTFIELMREKCGCITLAINLHNEV